MAYKPLVLPTLGSSDFKGEAAWQAGTAQSIVDTSQSLISALVDLKDTNYFSVGDIPSFFEPIFYAGGVDGKLLSAQRPVRPDMTPPNISALIARLNSLVLPTAPVLAFTYSDPGYSSSLRDPMISKLLSDLLTGGYGIDVDDETRLWNRERDREAAAMLMNVEEVKRQATGTSFQMPQGAMFALLQKAQQDFINKTSSVNRDIGIKRADMFVEQRRKVIEQVLAVESQNQALYNAIQVRGLEIARTQIAMAIALFEAGIKAIEIQLSAVLKQIEAQMEFSKTLAMVYNTDIAMYQVYVNALIADSMAFIYNQRNILDRDKTKLFASVEQVRFRLGQLQMTVDNAKDINKVGAEFYRTGLGASLSSTTGLAVQTTDVAAT